MQDEDTERADHSSGCKSAKTVILCIFFFLKTNKKIHLILSDLFVVAAAELGNIHICVGSVPASSLGDSLSNMLWITFTNFWIWFFTSQALFAIVTGILLVHCSCTQMAGKEVRDTGSPTEMQDSPQYVWKNDKIKAKFICSQDLDGNHHLAVLVWPCPGI